MYRRTNTHITEMIIPSPIHLVFANNIKYHNESTVLQQSIMNYLVVGGGGAGMVDRTSTCEIMEMGILQLSATDCAIYFLYYIFIV